MRTPNTACVVCDKPLYRRPSDMGRSRFAACFQHRAEAQKRAGITERQASGLRLGRVKGTNHRAGYRHRPESKAKAAESHRAFWTANPERLAERGKKIRGEAHYRWNGGSSRLNLSIRQMTENRKWMEAVRARDGRCVRCGSADHLESHHREGLAELIRRLGIKSRDDARKHAAVMWDLANGETLCRCCHYKEHGRGMDAH